MEPGGLPGCFQQKRWLLDGIGALRVLVADSGRLRVVDRQWPALRGPAALNWHWQWSILARGRPDCFAIVNDEGVTLVLWCGAWSGEHYRLENFEVHPLHQRSGLGALGLGLVCARALDLGCTTLRLQAIPETVPFYQTAGAAPEDGLLSRADVVPMIMTVPAMRGCVESTDAFVEG